MKYLIDLPPYNKKDWEKRYWDFRNAVPGNYIHPEGYLEPHRRLMIAAEMFREDGNPDLAAKYIAEYDHAEQIKAAWACAETLGDTGAVALFGKVEKWYRLHEKYGDDWCKKFPPMPRDFVLAVEGRYRIEARISRVASGMPEKGLE